MPISIYHRSDPFYNVKRFGARGDWTAPDDNAFLGAIETARQGGGGTVIIPPGIYMIVGTLPAHGNISIIGSGLNTILRPFHAMDHVPLFKTSEPSYHIKMANFLVDYSSCRGGSVECPSINRGDLAFDFGGDVEEPDRWYAFSDFENIRIQYAYQAFADHGGWMSNYRNVSWWFCKYGFNSNPYGTTRVFNSCWGRGLADIPGHETDCVRAWDMTLAINTVLNSCGFDNYASPCAALFTSAQGLTMNGWHMEVNRTTGLDSDSENLIRFDNCQAVSINGMFTDRNHIVARDLAGRWDYFVRIREGHGVINGIDIGEGKSSSFLDDYISAGGAKNPSVATIGFEGASPFWTVAGSRIGRGKVSAFTGNRYSLRNAATGGKIALNSVSYPAGTAQGNFIVAAIA